MTNIIIILGMFLIWTVVKYIRGDYKISGLVMRIVAILMVGQMVGKVVLFLEVIVNSGI